MAGWRQVVELAMSNEEVARLAAVSRSRTEPASRVERAQMLLAYRGRIHRFLRLHEGSEAITRRSNAASNERWPMAPWWRLTTDRDLAKSRQSRRRPRLGWSPWRATRPRSTGIRTSCGPRACWPAMRASMGRRPDTAAWPGWFRAPSARFSTGRKSSRTRCATTWSAGTPSLSRRWRRLSASIARSKSSSGRPPSRRKPASRWRSSPTTKSRNPGHRHDLAGFAARAWRPPDLRA